MRLALLFGLFTLTAFSASAQKIAFVNAQQIMYYMPEFKAAELRIDSISKSKQKQLAVLDSSYKTLMAEYQKKYNSLDEADKDDYLFRLQNTQQRYENYAAKSEQVLYEEQQKALKPINDKLQDAIKEIAKQEGYVHVLDLSAVLYTSDESADITELVAQKLGIDLQAARQAAQGTPPSTLDGE